MTVLVHGLFAQWADWSNQYPYNGHRVYSHTMHRTSDDNLLLCASIHSGWTPGSGIPFEDYAIAMYLIKVLPSGDTLWTQRIDSIKPWAITHVVDLIDGNTLIAGTAASSYTYCGFAVAGLPMSQLFAMKIDQAGSVLWWHQYDQPCSRILADAWESPDQEIHLLALDTQEPNIMIGYDAPNWFEHHTLDAQGNTMAVTTFHQADKYYTHHHGTAAFDGGRFIAASVLDTVGQNTLYVQLEKLDVNGIPQGAFFVTDTSYRTPADLITTLDSGLLMLMPHEYSKSRLIHIDTLGNILWDNTYSTRFEEVLALPDMTYLAVGSTGNWQSPGMRQLCVTLLSSAGDSLWSRTYGDSLNDQGSSIELTPSGFIAYGTKDMHSGSVPPRLFLTWDTLGMFLDVAFHEPLYDPIRLYPNPASHQVIVDMGERGARMHAITVYDAYGRIVHRWGSQQGSFKATLDVATLAIGCYSVRTETDQGFGVGRLMVIH